MESKYRIVGGKLGEGSFGAVYKVANGSNQIFAAKFMNTNDPSALAEIRTLARAQHSHIIKLYDFGNWKGQAICLVLEFADVGTLTRAVLNGVIGYQEGNVVKLLLQLASALDYLHELRPHILHRDLKPDNILGVTTATATGTGISFKLADFGLAKILTGNEQGRYYANSRCGTEIYMAPEVDDFRNYSFSADIWSLGAVMTFVCNRRHLFTSWHMIQTWRKQATIRRDMYSVGLVDLLASMLDPVKGERPTAAEILVWPYAACLIR